MALNSYFLQGSKNEQFLMQDLINEQLTIYGIEVYYLPRKVFKTDNIIKEVQSSKFDDSFIIEAYLNNYEGYNPNSDLMTKFGLRLTNEVSLTISKERFEEFIAPFLEGMSSGIKEGSITEYTFEDLITRPKEGDLIYFPLGERLFEIKRVESEKPFYQLNKNYVYELNCELYEYENELIDTTIEEVDNTVEDEGYITTVNLVGSATTASGTASVGVSGMIGFIDLIDDGSGYVSAPTVQISPPPSGTQATAVAITTSKAGVKSIKEILLTNPGAGYNSESPPLVLLTGGGGVGAAVTIGVVDNGLSAVTISEPGAGYATEPTITFTGATGVGGTTASAQTVITDGAITAVRFSNAGAGYTVAPTVTFAGITTTGIGTFIFNETVHGQTSGVVARVKDFKRRTDISPDNPPVELRVSLNSGAFRAGEVLVGSISSARYIVDSYDTDSFEDPFDANSDIETEADNLLDFTEGNPFGDY
tara:strand:+ start:4311 stop:5741 length:1431 start_codon:yes stop_codon:yes gene_type:complete